MCLRALDSKAKNDTKDGFGGNNVINHILIPVIWFLKKKKKKKKRNVW